MDFPEWNDDEHWDSIPYYHSVEQLYQAFKRRLMAELCCDIESWHIPLKDKGGEGCNQ